jgi:hypothetical protein
MPSFCSRMIHAWPPLLGSPDGDPRLSPFSVVGLPLESHGYGKCQRLCSAALTRKLAAPGQNGVGSQTTGRTRYRAQIKPVQFPAYAHVTALRKALKRFFKPESVKSLTGDR